MKTDDKVWLVDVENPKPDPYIAIIECDKKTMKKPLHREYKICHSSKEAVRYALKLKAQYGARQIRLFYPTGMSLIVKP